jgi:hypothetical protein
MGSRPVRGRPPHAPRPTPHARVSCSAPCAQPRGHPPHSPRPTHGPTAAFEYFITESRAVCADSGSLLLSDLDSPAALCRLLDSLDDTDSPTRIRLELKSPTSHFGQRSVRSIDDIPVYASVKAVVDADGEVSAFEISYTTLFTFNGAYFFDLFGGC